MLNTEQPVERANPYHWIAMRRALQAAEASDPLLTVAEAQVALGGVCRRTVHRLIHQGKLKAVRFGSAGWWRISATEVKRIRSVRNVELLKERS